MSFQFSSLSDFLSMSGHGPYVWAAYQVTLVVMLSLVVAPALRMRQMRRKLMRQQRLESRRQQNHSGVQASPAAAK